MPNTARTSAWFTIATNGACGVSASEKSRPRVTGTRSVRSSRLTPLTIDPPAGSTGSIPRSRTACPTAALGACWSRHRGVDAGQRPHFGKQIAVERMRRARRSSQSAPETACSARAVAPGRSPCSRQPVSRLRASTPAPATSATASASRRRQAPGPVSAGANRRARRLPHLAARPHPRGLKRRHHPEDDARAEGDEQREQQGEEIDADLVSAWQSARRQRHQGHHVQARQQAGQCPRRCRARRPR